jgi:predicted RNA-binding protein YlxR (DUF448 family)
MRRPPTARTRRKVTPDAAQIDAPEPEDDEPEKGPLRRCAVTRERLGKERMIRFVVGPDRRIVPDLAARLPGRGIWLSAVGDVVETACTRGAFAKAARGQVTVPPNLASDLKVALARRIVDTMGLARRAGQAVSGFAKAREWLESGRAGLVVQARDGSPEERARFLSGRAQSVPVVSPLDAESLGAVFGREHAVHVVVAPGRLAEMLWIEAERLAGLESASPATGGTRRDDAKAGTQRRRGMTSPTGDAGRDGDPSAEPGGSDAKEAVEGAGG